MNPVLWLRSLSTRRQLWLGFGTVTAILLSAGLIGFLGLQSISVHLEKQTEVTSPRSTAARELEISILNYALGVRQYLSGDDAARQRVVEDEAAAASHLEHYTMLAESPRQRDFAARFRAEWDKLRLLGAALTTARRMSADESAAFARQTVRLEDILDLELQPDAMGSDEALNAITVKNLETTETIAMALLLIGVAIALVTSLAVGRAVLAGEAELRRSEERLTGLNATLEQKVAESTQELRELNSDLDRRVMQRTRALHDSQRKLRALVEQLTSAEEEERRRLATEMHDYLGQLLAVSQMSLGRIEKIPMAPEAKHALADARQALDESIAYTRTLMAQLSPQVLYDLGLPAALAWLGGRMEKQHRLRVEVSGEAADFKVDETRAVLAYQCARELLWNVVKHGATQQAKVSYELKDGALSLEVADRGRGFHLADLENRAAGNPGFGLFSIRQRLQLHRGTLTVESAPGQGTKVKIFLPAADGPALPAASVDAVQGEATTAGKKMLRVALVDDHQVMRQGLRRILEDYDDIRIVGEAKDGAEAIALARALKPDVFVMDFNMPGKNGVEATQRIIAEQPGAIVIGLSFVEDRYVQEAMKHAGAYACLTKEQAAADIHHAIVDAVNRQPPAG